MPGDPRWRRRQQRLRLGLYAAGHCGDGLGGGPPQATYGTAAADVEHLVITLSGGGTIRVRAIAAGEQKFFAFALAQGQHAVRWLAYDAARHGAGSGRFHGR